MPRDQDGRSLADARDDILDLTWRFRGRSCPGPQWTKADARRFRGNLGVATVNGVKRVVVITRTTAYMLVHYGCMLDTQGAAKTQGKESFAEMGVEHIPLENIFGVFPMSRVHHGPEPGDGFTRFLDMANCQRINPDRQLDHFGTKLYFRLLDIFHDTKGRGPFATAWGKTGAKEPDVKWTVSAINEFPITEASLNAFTATLADGSSTAFANKSVHSNKAELKKQIEGLGANIGKGLKPIKWLEPRPVRRSRLEDDLFAVVFLGDEHLVAAWCLGQSHGVGDDEARIDVPSLDMAEQ